MNIFRVTTGYPIFNQLPLIFLLSLNLNYSKISIVRIWKSFANLTHPLPPPNFRLTKQQLLPLTTSRLINEKWWLSIIREEFSTGQFNFLPSIRLWWNELRCFLREREGWRQRKQAPRSTLPSPLYYAGNTITLHFTTPFRVSSRAEAVFDLTLIRFLSDGDSLDARNRSWQKRKGTEMRGSWLSIHVSLSFSLLFSSLFSLPEINFLEWETWVSFSNRSTDSIYLFFENYWDFEFERIKYIYNYSWNLV